MLPGSGLYVIAGQDDRTFQDAREALEQIEGGRTPQ